ncbi:MAG: PP2C family protein-serine/threonine phosphatase [Acidobacteria bacterium]|nr:PP2C family protein-serine/threonine phosphatase [Acidobacteriota bacterium]MCI0626159.1 PP2C family protein-serine/threonine phosphatase [Acidobacteriota bacterium]MCI0718725.1 PP2C family protein-serine/threonine phosphatase [Acidobacteriota bacterium]
MRDKLYLIGFLVGAGLLLLLGRGYLPGAAVLITWSLTFGGTTAAAVLGVILYRLQLQLKASRLELARKEVELSIAREVQQALFPRQLPGGGGLEFSAVCIPSAGISGDYYDVLPLADGRLIFAIADISGKGVSAAILMANLQALLRALAPSAPDPSAVCRRLNEHLHQVTDAAKFATLFYAEWNLRERRLSYVNAGHNAPLLLRNGRGQRLEQGGMPLGMFPATEFDTGRVCLSPGDTLVLYSDGITEATARNGEEFGESRLEDVVKAHCGKPLAEIQAQVLAGVRQWSGSVPEDDMTLMIARATDWPQETSHAMR